MSQPSSLAKRTFSSHENPRVNTLEGLPLAAFWQRALGYWIDVLFAVVLWAPAEVRMAAFRAARTRHQPEVGFPRGWEHRCCPDLFWVGKLLGQWPNPRQMDLANQGNVPEQRANGGMAIYRASPWLWCRSARRGARFFAVLLGSQPHVCPRPPGRDDRCGCEKVIAASSTVIRRRWRQRTRIISQKSGLFRQLVLKIVGVLPIRDLDIERP